MVERRETITERRYREGQEALKRCTLYDWRKYFEVILQRSVTLSETQQLLETR